MKLVHERKTIRKKKNNAKKQGVATRLRKKALLGANWFINDDVYKRIGELNRRYNFLETVFVAYPANEEYANAYVDKKHRHLMRWSPWPVSPFRQNGKWGITFVISATEDDFKDPHNYDNLSYYVERLDSIRRMLGTSQMTSAGILPGELHRRGLISNSPEAKLTVKAVVQVEPELRKDALGWDEEVPLIITGGAGFIGSRLIKQLAGREVYSIDVDSEGNVDYENWPHHLRGERAVLINVTKKNALSDYIHLFWPELVLLNETYPEPSREELDRIFDIGASAYHVAGVDAFSLFSFPKAYAGGIPLCAAWDSPDKEIIVKKFY